jgi:uncharacterized OB-fold protein
MNSNAPGETGPQPFNDLLTLDLLVQSPDGPFLQGSLCIDCGQMHAGERIVCSRCMATTMKPVPLATTGTLYTHTTLRVGPKAPYTFAYIDLDDGVRILAHFDDESTSPAIGAEVAIRFDDESWVFTATASRSA